jgi:ADP-ribosylglycohydrolase
MPSAQPDHNHIKGALFGMFIGDALAMPVHWYYDREALKYMDDPSEALIANTMCGGDNAGRGSVIGALLGAVHGMSSWPAQWIQGLLHPPPVPVIEHHGQKIVHQRLPEIV